MRSFDVESGGHIPGKIEQDFARWMRKQLGFQVSLVNALVGVEPGMRLRVASVRGEAYGIAWYRLRTFALAGLAAAVALRNVLPVREGEIPVVPTVLTYLSVVGLGIAFIGRVLTRQYAWVECKDRERPVSRQDVRKLNEAVEKVRAWDAAKWKPARVLLVAGTNGFERSALVLAKALGIECYSRADEGFERAR